MESPLISIVLTLYNKAPYIEETLFSIDKQTYINRELIIIDDCSTDGSLEIAKSFCEKLGIINKCKFIQNEKNLRVAKTFERGLQEAKGEWISMCDGDDILMKNKLEKQLKVCEEKNVDFCFCEYGLINESNNLIPQSASISFMRKVMKYGFPHPDYKMYLLINNAIGSGLFFNQKIAQKLLKVGFPSTVYQDYWAVIGNHLFEGNALRMQEKLFYYRRCEQCITYNKGDSNLMKYQKMLVMRYNAQQYALSIVKDEKKLMRIKKLNDIDTLFLHRFENKTKIWSIVKAIIGSNFGLRYQGILLFGVVLLITKYFQKK